jgi:hypothetical protein
MDVGTLPECAKLIQLSPAQYELHIRPQRRGFGDERKIQRPCSQIAKETHQRARQLA